MELDAILRERYSVRKFAKKAIEKEKIDQIIEAGRLAPTAGNHQPQRVLVVESEEARNKMKECTPCDFDAPILFLVCYDKTAEHHNHFGGDSRPYGRVDASIVMTHMMLEAQNLGMGSVWVGLFNPDELERQFDIPNEFEILGILPVGYPATDSEASKMHYDKYPKEHTVFYNSYS